jgi:fructose-1,6-bisphosphatase I
MNFNRNVLTLDEFTINQLRQFPQATGELSRLLRDIGLAAKRVNVEVRIKQGWWIYWVMKEL